MPIEWEDITPEALSPGDKLMVVRGSGDGATARAITAGNAVSRNVGEGEGNIPVLDATGKIPAARLPASGIAPVRRLAADFEAGFVLAAGQIGYETDTRLFKMGDGSSTWSVLDHTGGGGVSSWDDLEDIPAALDAIGALTPAANRYLLYTGTAAASMATISANGQSLIAAADYAAMKALLDLEVGTDVQAYGSNLTALAALTLIADRLPYANGAGTMALAPLTAFARTLLDDADAAAVRTTLGLAGAALLAVGTAAGTVAAGDHTHTASAITNFQAALLALFGTPASALLGTNGSSAPVSVPMAVVPEATCYHVVTGALAGMSDQGAALDRWLHGAMTLTPAAGDIDWLWALDPAASVEDPEDALIEASRPSNAEVSLTDATSDSGVVRLVVPEPDDADFLAGLERRSIGFRLVNDDPYETLTVELGAPAVGYLTTQWRGALDDFDLTPGDEAHVWGRIRAGEIDFDQIIRAAAWSTITEVAGSGGTAAANNRTVLNVLEDDLIFAVASRADGQAITTPTGKGWQEASGAAFDAGRLLNTGRSVKPVWTFATADGPFNTGNFTAGTRIWTAAFRGVASVGRYAGAKAISASLDYPALPSPLAPQAHVVGFTSRVLTPHAKPTGATVVDTNAFNDSAGTTTSGAIWTMGQVSSHAPAALSQTSAAWEAFVLELIPRRIS